MLELHSSRKVVKSESNPALRMKPAPSIIVIVTRCSSVTWIQVVKAVNWYRADVLLAQVGLTPNATLNFVLTDLKKEESRRYKSSVKEKVEKCLSFGNMP